MSPTSTDAASRRYGRTVAVSVAVLLVTAAALTWLASRQPPRVQHVQFDAALAIERGGAQLFLTPNQSWSSAETIPVTVTPKLPATAQRRGATIVVEFAGPLRPSTDYRVSVGPVTGTHTRARGALEYSFRTPDTPFFVLRRSGPVDDGKADEIVDASGSQEHTVLRADTIGEYAVVGSSIVANTLAGNTAEIIVVGPDGDVTRRHRADDGGAFYGLRSEPATGLFGVVSSAGEGEWLHVQPLSAAGLAEPVTSLDGSPLDVVDWGFVPHTASIVARDPEGRVFLIDTSAPDVPHRVLGSYGSPAGFLPGTSTLAVPDSTDYGVVLLDLQEGSTARRPHVDPGVEDPTRFIQQSHPLAEDRFLNVELLWSSAERTSTYEAVVVDRDDRTVMLADDSGTALVMAACLSPDGRSAAISVTRSEGGDDGYPLKPARTRDTVTILDLESGRHRTVDGIQPHWCTSGPTMNRGPV